MPTSYVGSPTNTQSITIPQDLDNADAASVNTSSKAQLDNQVFLMQTYGQMMNSTCPMRAYSISPNQVAIRLLSLVFVQELGIWKPLSTSTVVTATAPPLAVNTWYYLYVYSVAGVATFAFDTVAPDQYRLFKAGTFSHRYICSVATDSVGDIRPFAKYNGEVNYIRRTDTTLLTGAAPLVDTTVNAAILIPENVIMAKLTMEITTSGASGTIVFSDIATSLYTLPILYPGANANTYFFDLPVSDSRQFNYKAVGASGITNATIGCVGYYE